MGKRKDPSWRDHAAARLMLGSVERGLAPWRPGPVLLAGAVLGATAKNMRERGLALDRWNRRSGPLGAGTPWPKPGPYQAAVVRLPKSVDELVMTAHAVRSAILEGAPILLYGAKDEGIESASGRVAAVWGPGGKVAVGGHCRVVRFVPPAAALEEGSTLSAWCRVHPAPNPSLGPEWISYPGVFGHRPLSRGLLDPGTQALLAALPTPPAGLRILDYGAGSGPVAAWIRSAQPKSRLVLVDIDAVALEAARENVPGAEAFVLSDRVPEGPWDLVVSNPPFHQGKAHSEEVLERFIQDASATLTRAGRLFFVSQRRLPVKRLLERAFRTQEILLDHGPFRVWSAAGPRDGIR